MKILIAVFLFFQGLSFSYGSDPLPDEELKPGTLGFANRLTMMQVQSCLKNLGVLGDPFFPPSDMQAMAVTGVTATLQSLEEAQAMAGADYLGWHLEAYIDVPPLGLTLSRLQERLGNEPMTVLFLVTLNQLRMVNSTGTLAYAQLLKFLEPEDTKKVFTDGVNGALKAIASATRDPKICEYVASLEPDAFLAARLSMLHLDKCAAGSGDPVEKSLRESGLTNPQITELLRLPDCSDRRTALISTNTEAGAYAYARAATGTLSRKGYGRGIPTAAPESNQALTFFLGVSEVTDLALDPMEARFSEHHTFIGDNFLIFAYEDIASQMKGSRTELETCHDDDRQVQILAELKAKTDLLKERSVTDAIVVQTVLESFRVDIQGMGHNLVPVGKLYQDRIAEVARQGVAFPSPRIHNLVAAILPWWSGFYFDSPEIQEKQEVGRKKFLELTLHKRHAEIAALEAEASAGGKPEDLPDFLAKVQTTQLRHVAENRARIQAFDAGFRRKYDEMQAQNTDLLLGLLYPLLYTFDHFQ